MSTPLPLLCPACCQVKGKDELIAVYEPSNLGSVWRTKAANNVHIERGGHNEEFQVKGLINESRVDSIVISGCLLEQACACFPPAV